MTVQKPSPYNSPTRPMNAPLTFNGVHCDTGAYLTPPLTPAQIAHIARGNPLDRAQLDDLDAALAQSRLNVRGPKAGVDADDLAETGWAAIFPFTNGDQALTARQAEIRKALAPLFELRREQASARDECYFRILDSSNDAYRPNETKRQYLSRLGVGPGPADPDYLPYYLLLVGSPEEIPYHLQYQLDVQYAVGRIHFDTIAEYAAYAHSVVAAETSVDAPTREAMFFAAANPNDDATALSLAHLAEPVAKHAAQLFSDADWRVRTLFGDRASKGNLVEAICPNPKASASSSRERRAPQFLFTATHGLGFNPDDRRQRELQGALLCQDWRGPGTSVNEDTYFAGRDIPQHADLTGLISFHFACYSTGTPRRDEFPQDNPGSASSTIAPRSFVARLPQRLLGHPGGGALAAVGHIERAWTYSFMNPERNESGQTLQYTSAFKSAIQCLLSGHRLGHAMEYFNIRYAEAAAEITAELQASAVYDEPYTDERLATLWLESTDARNYAVVGDPAVRLSKQLIPARTRPDNTIADIRHVPPPRTHGNSDLAANPDDLSRDITTRIRQLLDTSTTIAIHTKAEDEQLSATTHVKPSGETIVTLPMRDGQLDEAVWNAHLAVVEQTRADRHALWQLMREWLSQQRM